MLFDVIMTRNCCTTLYRLSQWEFCKERLSFEGPISTEICVFTGSDRIHDVKVAAIIPNSLLLFPIRQASSPAQCICVID